jgi:hypothetical protein
MEKKYSFSVSFTAHETWSVFSNRGLCEVWGG